MTIKEANSLKPCPFCGHTAILNTSTDGKYYWVSCTNDECNSNSCKPTKEEVIDAWNKRYDEKSLSETYYLKGARKMTDEEKEKILESLNYKDENGEERKSNMWMPLFLLTLAMSGNQTPNIQLEKEVSYLSGKVDTLEKIIVSKGLMKDV